MNPTRTILILSIALLSVAQAQKTDLSVALYAANPEAPSPGANWETADLLNRKLGINLKFTMLPTGADGDNIDCVLSRCRV